MRNLCSNSKKKKDLSAYDFSEEDLAVESDSANYKSKLKLKSEKKEEKEESLKYEFLQNFSSGFNCKQANVDCVLHIDLHENSSPEASSIDSSERNFATDKKFELSENMASTTSYEDCVDVCLGSFDTEMLIKEDRGPELVSDLQSDGTPVDVISEDEVSSTSEPMSPSASASDIAEGEGYMEHPLAEACFTAPAEKEKDDLAVTVSPDYVIYENILYGDAQLFFSSDSILVNCSDASGNIVLECTIADIIQIECQWSGSVGATLVKFLLRTLTVNNSKIHESHEAVELIFAVTDVSWLEKEQKIKCLAERYKDLWNVPHYDDSEVEDDSAEHKMFFPRHYFTEIPDSFEEVIYPKGDPDAVSISRRDIELLQPDTFVNDTIIDFYIKYLKSKIPLNERHRFHFFNSFFFRKLADLDKDPGSASEGRAAFLRVRKWTRKVNIFEKDYIFIPVNFNLHWSLLIICHPGEVNVFEDDETKVSPKVPCILHMDSIKGSHNGLKNLVQSYLLEEWKERHPEPIEDYTCKFLNLRFVSLELPQQDNSFDCGLFLLHYVELFLEDAPLNFNPLKISKFSNFLTIDWFIPSEASFKRSFIRKLIYDLLNDKSQNITSESRYNDNSIEKKPVEFLNEHFGQSKTTLDTSLCSITVKGIEMNLDTSSPSIVENKKQEDLVMHEFIGLGTNSMSIFEEDGSIQIPKCSTEVITDVTEQLNTSGPDKDECEPVDKIPNTQTCLFSDSLNDVKELDTQLNCTQEKDEAVLDQLPKVCDNHEISNQNDEKQGSISIEDRRHVPDSPTSSSGDNNIKEVGVTTETDGSRTSKHEQIQVPTETVEVPDDGTCDQIVTDVDKTKVNDNNDDKKQNSADHPKIEIIIEIEGENNTDGQQNNTPENSEDSKDNINSDEKSRKKRNGSSTRHEIRCSKRRKGLQLEGTRRLTRSFLKDCKRKR